MEVTKSQMQGKRLVQLARGVKAAAMAIDEKFREAYGHPEFTPSGKYSRFSPFRVAMITLTYCEDGMWEESQIRSLVKHYREWFKRNGKGETFHYVWVMELTEVGRPHYHLVCWLPRGVKPPLPDKQGWWPHGMTQAIYARSPVGYITKYASKGETKSGAHLPHKARLWGYGGLLMSERGDVAYALAPRWLKHVVHHDSRPAKRVFERVINTIQYACGRIHQHIERKSGWFLRDGEAKGWWFFGPYDCDGFTANGISLSHRGAIEVFTPDGDTFFIPHAARS
ncbi:rolling circle replication-associated protein [Pseudoxanthomonas winnipegensis]|uniref:rolling circle replication-associated protein n=1 Tax=Pseudoxanthomonas winnipegensis TaxID=2480810 RepID=UPI00102D9841|nr:adhesin [Pseudoxanthomonas winnipegensis]TAA08846.1 adhesin [Pseudoxanthomonas winnipegensis]TAH71800.1 adhesin [Pseudoxanthomonas winnipegensis]